MSDSAQTEPRPLPASSGRHGASGRHRLAVGGSVLLLVAATASFVPSPSSAFADTPQVVSPEVVHTGTGPTGYDVTFRFYDGNPLTKNVKIRGEWYLSDVAHTTTTTSAGRLPNQYQPGDFPIASPNRGAAANWPVTPMIQDPGTLVWSYTTPLPPGTWTYGFLLNCSDDTTNSTVGCPTSTELADPGNPPWNTSGSVEPTSQAYVPSDPTFGTADLSSQAPNPVHGSLTDVSYPDPQSTNPVGSHPLAVYTPPGYDPKRRVPYPTLYLSHGAGGNEVDWTTQGAAAKIIDNLIAAGQAQPMVVVMTNFNGLLNGNDGYRADVLNYVIPYVEAHYNVAYNANDRAFAGLSAGGSRANNILFNAPTAFGYYGVWSIGLGGAPASDSPLWQDPDLKTRLAIHSGGGLFDSITFPNANTYLALMASNGIPVATDFIEGGHEWYVWRQLLRDFAATLAFRHTTTTASVPARSVYSQPVRFIASVAADTTEPARLTGSISFYLDGVSDAMHLLGTSSLDATGTARIIVHDLPGSPSAIGVCTHTVTAVYGGDKLYNSSTSDAATFTVVAQS